MDAYLIIEGYTGMPGDCNVYETPDQEHTHLAVCVMDEPFPNGGFQVFACDHRGWAPSMDALLSSYVYMPHDVVLAEIGFVVVPKPEPEPDVEP